jgi:hypothetical protein
VTDTNVTGSLIPIIYTDYDVTGEKGLLSTVRTASSRIGVLDSTQLADNLSTVCERFSSVFRAAQHATDGFELHEFEVAVEVTAAGEVRFVGSVSTEIRGGMKLVFRRSSGPQQQ